jgi:hypothetical protein
MTHQQNQIKQNNGKTKKYKNDKKEEPTPFLLTMNG